MASRSSCPPGKAKVKSGCRTCKIRRIKCDEGRPACQRCISTGRVCDGYGIWGGGGNFYGNRQTVSCPKNNCIITRPSAPIALMASGTEDTSYYEWFTYRTAPKLPGSFRSGFWIKLLFQAAPDEPAVLHAVLALSSAHKLRITSPADEHEQFTLQHYVKAITHLQPHFSIKNRASSRVALITCVIFVCLEFLRGHFETAQIHLQNGLRILGEMNLLSISDDGILCLKTSREYTDNWIVEAFSRLQFQVELFKYTYGHPCILLQTAQSAIPALSFHSIKDAWQHLERLLNKIFHLTHRARQITADLPLPALLEKQANILNLLAQWRQTHKASRGNPRSDDEEKVYQLLYLYHSMAIIMVKTCLQPHSESIFDAQTPQFLLLVRQATAMMPIASMAFNLSSQPAPRLDGRFDMSRTIIDMGWVPPLFYVAVKCRVHCLRMRALKLLALTNHREGIWDSITAACVASKVVEVEEGHFYEDIVLGHEPDPSSEPSEEELDLPALPEEYRLRELEVVLAGAPMDRVSIFCKQKRESVDERVLVAEYDVNLRRWKTNDRVRRVAFRKGCSVSRNHVARLS